MKGQEGAVLGELALLRIVSKDFFYNELTIVNKVGEKIILPVNFKSFLVKVLFFFQIVEEFLEQVFAGDEVQIVCNLLF